MAKLFDFIKADNHFVDSALDPAKRTAAIRELTRNRPLFFGITLFVWVICLIFFIFLPGDTFTLLLLTFFVSWTIICIRVDTEIKVLKTFERMESLSKADGE